MIEFIAAIGLILAGVGFSLGVLLNQGTLTIRGRAVARALDCLIMALALAVVALVALLIVR